MNFKSKLARLSTRGLAPTLAETPAAAPVPPSPSAVPATEPCAPGPTRAVQLRHRIDALRLAKPPPAQVSSTHAAWLDDIVVTPSGPLCRILTPYAPGARQGDTPIGPCLEVGCAALAALTLDASMHGVDSARLLFVDTETTGLAGGAGTVPFLIGVGYFVDGALVIEQWMLRGMGEEVPMLERLATCLEAADAIVTYNGKSFDWPLLRTRFILNRVRMPKARPHIDLLHCTRRMLKRRAPEGVKPERGGLRLSAVERSILGFARIGDIDGAHIPERYFAYLRGETPTLLDAVIEHNRHDLVSLAALLGHLGHRLDDVALEGSTEEHLNLAHLAQRGAHTTRAMAFAARAARCSTAHVRAEAALLLGQMLVRERRFGEAADALRGGLQLHAPGGLLHAALHLALAKLLEHRLGDIAGALGHAAHTLRAEGALAFGKRCARLARKQQRTRAIPSGAQRARLDAKQGPKHAPGL